MNVTFRAALIKSSATPAPPLPLPLPLPLIKSSATGGSPLICHTYLDGLGSLHCDLIIGGVPVWETQVKVLDVDVQVGQDQLGLDHGPDHPEAGPQEAGVQMGSTRGFREGSTVGV